MRRMIRLDWAIKKILREKANFDILEGFLSELLLFDIRIEEILESESNQEAGDDKYNRVDILAKDSNGQLIIIEVQNESEADYLQRLLFGTSKAIVEHLPLGSPYANIKKVYSVSIVHFHLGEGEDYLYHGTTSFIGLHTKEQLKLKPAQQKLFGIQAPADLMPEYYIIKVPAFDNKIRNTIDEWIYFLKNEELPENFKAKGLQAAKEKLDVLKMTDEERNAYNAYLNNLHYKASMTVVNYQEGVMEGEIRGEAKGQAKIVAHMLKQGMSPEAISEMTGLSKDEVIQLSQDL